MGKNIELSETAILSGSCINCGDVIREDTYCSCRVHNREIEANEIAFQQGEMTYKELDEIGKRISEDNFIPCCKCDGHDACWDFGCAINQGIIDDPDIL